MNEFANRLNLLFAAFLRPSAEQGRRPEEWSDSAVTRLADERAPRGEQPALTRQYLGMLRNGKRQPSLRSANTIAVAFAELSRCSGTPVDSATILNYLAGDHPAARLTDLEPNELRCALVGRPSADVEELAYLARAAAPDTASAGSLDAVRSLIEQLSRQDAAPMRRRLARLLGTGGACGSPDPDPGR